jgi:hypothetical protein
LLPGLVGRQPGITFEKGRRQEGPQLVGSSFVFGVVVLEPGVVNPDRKHGRPLTARAEFARLDLEHKVGKRHRAPGPAASVGFSVARPGVCISGFGSQKPRRMRLPAAVLFLVLPIALVGQGVLTQVLLTLCGVVCLFGFPGGYTPRYGEYELGSSSRVALLAGPIGLVTASLCPPDQLSVRRHLHSSLPGSPAAPCHRGAAGTVDSPSAAGARRAGGAPAAGGGSLIPWTPARETQKSELFWQSAAATADIVERSSTLNVAIDAYGPSRPPAPPAGARSVCPLTVRP